MADEQNTTPLMRAIVAFVGRIAEADEKAALAENAEATLLYLRTIAAGIQEIMIEQMRQDSVILGLRADNSQNVLRVLDSLIVARNQILERLP